MPPHARWSIASSDAKFASFGDRSSEVALKRCEGRLQPQHQLFDQTKWTGPQRVLIKCRAPPLSPPSESPTVTLTPRPHYRRQGRHLSAAPALQSGRSTKRRRCCSCFSLLFVPGISVCLPVALYAAHAVHVPLLLIVSPRPRKLKLLGGSTVCCAYYARCACCARCVRCARCACCACWPTGIRTTCSAAGRRAKRRKSRQQLLPDAEQHGGRVIEARAGPHAGPHSTQGFPGAIYSGGCPHKRPSTKP